jgi:SWI/SNF-related matrix-associated actin-dependent regulator 1 of chromatin subfamily A
MAGKAEDDSDRYMDIPLPLRLKMMAFQREGVRFALAHGGRALIGDEMGAWHWHCLLVG